MTDLEKNAGILSHLGQVKTEAPVTSTTWRNIESSTLALTHKVRTICLVGIETQALIIRKGCMVSEWTSRTLSISDGNMNLHGGMVYFLII